VATAAATAVEASASAFAASTAEQPSLPAAVAAAATATERDAAARAADTAAAAVWPRKHPFSPVLHVFEVLCAWAGSVAAGRRLALRSGNTSRVVRVWPAEELSPLLDNLGISVASMGALITHLSVLGSVEEQAVAGWWGEGRAEGAPSNGSGGSCSRRHLPGQLPQELSYARTALPVVSSDTTICRLLVANVGEYEVVVS